MSDDLTPFPTPGGPPPSNTGSSANRGARRAVVVALLAATVAVFGLFAVGFGVAVWALNTEDTADIEDGSFLAVTLQGVVSDAPPQGGLFVEPEDFPPTATEVAAAIRKAADDDRIEGVYLHLRNPQMGWALAREVRTALVALREADKPCVAYAEVWTTRDYYLGSACDRVMLPPAGVPAVLGTAMSVTYYKDALNALGVEPRFVWVGDYKTAIEPYQRTEPSEAAIESYEYLLDGLWTTVVEEIASSRGLTVDAVQAAIDQPSLTPRGMVAAGLFDGVAYPDAIEAHLRDATAEDWLDRLEGDPAPLSKEARKALFTPLKEYRKTLDEDAGSQDARIAVVFAEGAILSGESEGGLFGEAGLFDRDFARWMRQVREDDTIKAVVLRVNSPGGSALAADMMHRELELVKAAGKPVVVSMGDYAASGGYMISAPADWIVAHPNTITGSIGVFGQFFDLRGTWDKLELHEHVYKRGDHADLLYLVSEQGEGDRAILQAFVSDTYTDFVELVADGRSMEATEVEAVAQGRVWTGSQAMGERGLVDEIGGLEVALAKARELADTTDAGVVHLPEKKGFMELLMEELATSQAPRVALELPIPGAEEAVHELMLMRAWQASGGVVAYLPGRPTLR